MSARPAVNRDLTQRLRDAFIWQGGGADPAGWWLDPRLLRDLTRALADLHADERVTLVIGVASRGMLLGPLVAQHLDSGFVEVRKDLKADGRHGQGVLRRRTFPDYAGRDLTLSIGRGLVHPRDRVLLVDDWIQTGAQAQAAARLIQDSEAAFVGAAIIVDATTASCRRRVKTGPPAPVEIWTT